MASMSAWRSGRIGSFRKTMDAHATRDVGIGALEYTLRSYPVFCTPALMPFTVATSAR